MGRENFFPKTFSLQAKFEMLYSFQSQLAARRRQVNVFHEQRFQSICSGFNSIILGKMFTLKLIASHISLDEKQFSVMLH